MTPHNADRALPRAPSSVIVVDANIALALVLGRGSRSAFELAANARKLTISARAIEEVQGVLKNRQGLPSDISELADALFAGIEVIDRDVYSLLIDGAARALRHAVPSKNGSEKDAHLLACAWAFDADIWSHDRDLAGSGWPSWSTGNLRYVLETERDAALP